MLIIKNNAACLISRLIQTSFGCFAFSVAQKTPHEHKKKKKLIICLFCPCAWWWRGRSGWGGRTSLPTWQPYSILCSSQRKKKQNRWLGQCFLNCGAGTSNSPYGVSWRSPGGTLKPSGYFTPTPAQLENKETIFNSFHFFYCCFSGIQT